MMTRLRCRQRGIVWSLCTRSADRLHLSAYVCTDLTLAPDLSPHARAPMLMLLWNFQSVSEVALNPTRTAASQRVGYGGLVLESVPARRRWPKRLCRMPARKRGYV